MDLTKLTAAGFLEKTSQRATYLFRLFGYARSGQHAISHWLMQQGPPTSLWINNLQGYGNDVDFQHYWYGPMNFDQIELMGLGFEGDLRKLSYNFAEVPLILVIRDIYNQTASIAKHPDLHINTTYFEAWRRNALQALGKINLLKSPVIIANYNNWVASDTYKSQLFEEVKECLCFPYHYMEGKDKHVIDIGGGSSFDGIKNSGTAQNMKVLERYKDPAVREAISLIPQELKDLNQLLFPSMRT